MNTVQRIVKNVGVLFIARIASYILGFFFIMYTARYLGAEGFGINPFKKRLRKMLRISFALAFTGIFGVFADLGLGALTVREVARDKELAGKYLGNIAVMKVILENTNPSIFLNRKITKVTILCNNCKWWFE